MVSQHRGYAPFDTRRESLSTLPWRHGLSEEDMHTLNDRQLLRIYKLSNEADDVVWAGVARSILKSRGVAVR